MSHMADLPPWIADRLHIFPAAVAVETCNAIARKADAHALGPGLLHDNASGERYLNPHVRLTSVSFAPERDATFELMQSFATRVNETWNFDLTDADPLQYALYRKNDFFECHKDMLRVRNKPIRKISVVLQLSRPQDYTGGTLQFFDEDAGLVTSEAFAQQGSVAVFASLLRHRVTPVKHGERRSLTAWFKGPPFR